MHVKFARKTQIFIFNKNILSKERTVMQLVDGESKVVFIRTSQKLSHTTWKCRQFFWVNNLGSEF